MPPRTPTHPAQAHSLTEFFSVLTVTCVRVRAIWSSISGESNPADILTKVLGRQPFEKHRKFMLNLAADHGVEQARRARDGAGAT